MKEIKKGVIEIEARNGEKYWVNDFSYIDLNRELSITSHLCNPIGLRLDKKNNILYMILAYLNRDGIISYFILSFNRPWGFLSNWTFISKKITSITEHQVYNHLFGINHVSYYSQCAANLKTWLPHLDDFQRHGVIKTSIFLK